MVPTLTDDLRPVVRVQLTPAGVRWAGWLFDGGPGPPSEADEGGDGWSPGVGVDTSIGLGVGYKEPVDLQLDRSNGTAYLILGDHVAEIRLERGHLETIGNQLAGVFADLDQIDGAGKRAAEAGSRAMELAAYLMDQALSAELAGELETAGELRGTADKLTAAVNALDNAVAAVEDAALAADQMSTDGRQLLDERIAKEAKERASGDQRAEAEPAGVA